MFTARRTRAGLAVGALLGASALVLSACAANDPLDTPSASAEDGTIVVGSQSY